MMSGKVEHLQQSTTMVNAPKSNIPTNHVKLRKKLPYA